MGPRFLAAVLALLAVVAGGWVWLRDSSLVAVRQVAIAGVSGPDAVQIRSALRDAAHSMTTLDVKMGALRTAVSPYPVVKHLNVSTGFPHRLQIDVVEQVPVAMVSAGGRQVAVAGDGTLLRDAAVTGSLPTISLAVAPGGTQVSGGARGEVRLLAAAPYALLAKVSAASRDATHGLVAQLRNGPKLYFGAGTELGAKWAAAAAAIAAPGSPGADYIDVTDPSRPAAGAGSDTRGGPAAGSAAATAGGVTGGN